MLKGVINTDSIGSSIYVINITQKQGTISSSRNTFEIVVKKNDTLLFSAINLQEKVIGIDQKIMESGFLEVYLQEKIYQLEEISLHNLSGNLEKDIDGIPIFNKFKLNIPMAKKPPPTQTERRIYTATTGPGGSRLTLLTALTGRIPVDPILNFINGRTKKLKKRKELEEIQSLVQKEKEQFHEDFFTIYLKIPESKIIDFLYYCFQSQEFKKLIKGNYELEIIKFYKKESAEYLNY